jgi:hypothetical protein
MSENAVKKYIIRLSGAERETLDAFIRTGKGGHGARAPRRQSSKSAC